MDLLNKTWLPFQIGKLFDSFEQGKCKNASELKGGECPYIGATNRNNGVLKFVEYNSRIITKGNCIIFISQGDGSAGYSIYKKEDCICGSTVIAAYADFINEYVGMFISCCSDLNQSKYSHGHARTLERLKKDYIMLPVNQVKEPDFEFMEEYVKRILLNDINLLKRYITKMVQETSCVPAKKIEHKIWKKFKISMLFDVKIGKNVDGNKIEEKNGKIAYVTRKENNNGIDNFINYDDNYCNKVYPVITIGNETAKPYIQQYPFFTGTKVNILIPKFESNRYVLLFFCQVIELGCKNYSYSYTINSTRLREQTILLPVDCNNEPDFKYMEQYIKNIMNVQYKRYLDFIE